MSATTPATIDTATALRLALGPGYGFAGPSDQLLNTVVCPNGNCHPSPNARR